MFVPALALSLLAFPSYMAYDIGVLAGDTESEARAVNRNGVVVGFSSAPGGDAHGFVWSKDQGLQRLALPSGATSAVPYAINDSDEIAGAAYMPDGLSMCLWTSAKSVRIVPGGEGKLPMAMNDAGTVVGYGSSSPYPSFAWSSSRGFIRLASIFPGSQVLAKGVNDQNQIVGNGELGNDYNSSGLLWESPGQEPKILLKRNTGVEITGINGDGYIVGYLWNSAVWGAGFLIDPKGQITEIGPHKFHQYGDAPTGIDDYAEVAGNFSGGNNNAWLLTVRGGLTDLHQLVVNNDRKRLYVSAGMSRNGNIAGTISGPNFSWTHAAAFLRQSSGP